MFSANLTNKVLSPVRPIDLFRHICIILHPLFSSRSVHSQDSRRFDYEAPLVATNENMATGSEPAVKKERM